MKDHFDLLSLSINLWRPKPRDPKDFVHGALWYPWDDKIEFMSRRVLLHETMHFWQLLSFPCLQRAVNEEWLRLLVFATENRIEEIGPELRQLRRRDQQEELSSWDLLEGLTRYWEVASQPPLELLRQEAVVLKDKVLLDTLDPSKATFRFPWVGIEFAMLRGMNCDHYGVPYRWCLTQIREAMGITTDPQSIPVAPNETIVGPNQVSPGLAAALIFPIVAFLALCTNSPASTFTTAIREMCRKGFVHQFNLNFVGVADHVLGLFVYFDRILQFVLDTGAKPARLSPDRWDNTIGPDRPPYAWSASGARDLSRVFALVKEEYDDELARETEDFIGRYGLMGAMSLMGVREIRQTLSSILPPPRIAFEGGFKLHLRPQSSSAQPESATDADRRDRVLDVISGVADRFRRAEKAVSLGLPVDAFET